MMKGLKVLGQLFLFPKFFYRIARYNHTGHFIATYPYPSGGGASKYTSLAVGADGRIYLEKQQTVFTCTPDLQVISTLPTSCKYWKLTEDNQVVCGSMEGREEIPYRVNRAAIPGDPILNVLIADERKTFQTHDGGTLVRKMASLQKQLNGNTVITYGPSWLLQLFTLPLPGGLAWPVLGILVYIKTRDPKGSRNRSEST